MKTTLHPDVNYTARVLAGTNGDVRGVNSLRAALMQNWTKEQKYQHAGKLLMRCAKIQDECLALCNESITSFEDFDMHYTAFLKYHRIALRLLQYRINLIK